MLPVDCKELHFHYKSEIAPTDVDVRHCHDKYEILYVAEGSGKCIVEGRALDIKSGNVVLISPLQYHYLALDGGRFERFVVQFGRHSLYPETEEIIDSIIRRSDEENLSVAILQAPAGITELLSRFDSVCSLPIPKSQAYTFMRMMVSQLILLLSASDGENLAEETGELGARVIRYLNTHIDRDVSLDFLARYFFVSKFYLCRAFKSYNGISVHGYLTQKRIMQAKQLIESGVSASDAAYRIGFGDYSAFYRAYVKTVGHSPSIDAEHKRTRNEITVQQRKNNNSETDTLL